MDYCYGPLFCVCQQNGDTIRHLHSQQNSALASDQRVALWGAFPLQDIFGTHKINNVRMNLAKQDRANGLRLKCSEKFLAVRKDPFRLVPFREAKIENRLSRFFAVASLF